MVHSLPEVLLAAGECGAAEQNQQQCDTGGQVWVSVHGGPGWLRKGICHPGQSPPNDNFSPIPTIIIYLVADDIVNNIYLCRMCSKLGSNVQNSNV